MQKKWREQNFHPLPFFKDLRRFLDSVPEHAVPRIVLTHFQYTFNREHSCQDLNDEFLDSLLPEILHPVVGTNFFPKVNLYDFAIYLFEEDSRFTGFHHMDIACPRVSPFIAFPLENDHIFVGVRADVTAPHVSIPHDVQLHWCHLLPSPWICIGILLYYTIHVSIMSIDHISHDKINSTLENIFFYFTTVSTTVHCIFTFPTYFLHFVQ